MATIKGKHGIMYNRELSRSKSTWIQWRQDSSWQIVSHARLLCDDQIIRNATCRIDRSGYPVAKISVKGKTVTGTFHSRYIQANGIACDEFYFVPKEHGKNSGLIEKALYW